MQAVEDADDALFQRSPAHDAVVDDHQVVLVGIHAPVSDVIHMRGQIVPAVAFRNERTQFDVLDSHFLATDILAQDAFELLMSGLMPQRFYLGNLGLVQICLESVQHAIKGDFRRVRNKREHRMFQIPANGFQDGIAQLHAQSLTLQVNIAVASTAEIDSFERTGFHLLGLQDLFQTHLSVLMHADRLPRHEFVYLLRLQCENRLDDRTLGSHDQNLIVFIPKGRSDTPRVAQDKHLAAARRPTHHITAVPQGGRRAQHVVYVDTLLDIACNVHTGQPQPYGFGVKAFAFAVEPVPHLLQHDISVGINPGMLPFGRNVGKYLIHIRQIEIAAQRKVFRPPVVAPQKRMDKRKATLSGR